MNNQPQTHLSEDDLILFMDRELSATAAANAEQHLMQCGDCSQRLKRLKAGSAAYAQYREAVLKPTLPVPETGWARLSQEVIKEKRRRWGWGWAAACACGLALAIAYFLVSEQPSAQQVLSRAEAAEPVPATARLLLTTGHERLYRPAVLESGPSEVRFQHVRALFVQANYSWENPLSARSFSSWRKSLPQKEDAVTLISAAGGRKFYRVQTSTSESILRSASLTLQAESYHPTKVDLSFVGQDPVELSEQTEPPKNGLEVVQAPAPMVMPKVIESPATPEDELRVFAALDAMGAEAEEPIDVKMDMEHHSVLLTGMGLATGRRKEIENAVGALPRTVLHFSSGPRLSDDPAFTSTPNNDAPDESQAFRQNLQDRYGGAHQLQAATDKALDASNGLFARAHLLFLLAREFPPGVESTLSSASATSLLSMRQRDVGAMEYALRQLKEELLPLSSDSAPQESNNEQVARGAAWQSVADALFTNARNLDSTVSRLLSGRYTEQEGNTMLKQLPSDLTKVEILIRAQSITDK